MDRPSLQLCVLAQPANVSGLRAGVRTCVVEPVTSRVGKSTTHQRTNSSTHSLSFSFFAAMLRNAPIQWAQVVDIAYGKHANSRDDWKEKAKGRLAIRLLGRGDCDVMAPTADQPLDPGSIVAIIDL
jgi:hypothetical protein